MAASPRDLTPLSLSTLGPAHPALQEAEVEALKMLQDAGLAAKTILVIPAAAEERFYRLNTLASKLEALVTGVDLADPDEDDIEDIAPQAARLFKTHFLLDEFIDGFYEAVEHLPAKLRIRRAGTAGKEVIRGQPALVALKEVWAADWTFEALMMRLEQTASIALEARPVLISPAEDAPAGATLLSQLQTHSPDIKRAWIYEGQGVTRLELSPSSG